MNPLRYVKYFNLRKSKNKCLNHFDETGSVDRNRTTKKMEIIRRNNLTIGPKIKKKTDDGIIYPVYHDITLGYIDRVPYFH